MTQSVQKYTVTIGNQSYSIVSDESFDIVQELSHEVHEQMKKIAHAIGSSDMQKIATYTALMYASTLRDHEKKVKALISLCTHIDE